jgi:hypothetical protein
VLVVAVPISVAVTDVSAVAVPGLYCCVQVAAGCECCCPRVNGQALQARGSAGGVQVSSTGADSHYSLPVLININIICIHLFTIGVLLPLL